MDIQKRYKAARQLLKKHNQEHLLAFWPQLSHARAESLLSQIETLDFNKIDYWIAKYVKGLDVPIATSNLAPAASYPPAPQGPDQKQKYSEAARLGKDLISKGRLAALVVAGGQGTRLGFDGPKGDFPISPVKNKTLFQIFAETIDAAGKKYGPDIAWYIMTSPLNHTRTIEIFQKNDYYGLKKDNVFIFQQGTVPSFSLDGRMLLAEKDQIACAPDGHGGSLKALYQSRAVEHMKRRGIEYIGYFQVDNPLINIFDPLFIGLHAMDRAEMSSKALVKTGPGEKVGNFCLVNGRLTVIEYSDMPVELAEKKKQNGSLFFELGSIAIHLINTSFVERLNTGGFALPFHRAVKKIPCIDEEGRPIEPEKPNGVKLETFVFDALPLASKSIILQTTRSEEFAPVKNATGIDSIEIARRMMVERAASWLEASGISVPRKADGSSNALIEIAPSFAIYKEDIRAKKDMVPDIGPGDKVYLQ